MRRCARRTAGLAYHSGRRPNPRRSGNRPYPATVKARIVIASAAIIDIGRQREEREILTIHVVLQIEDARKTGAGDLRFLPGTIALLRREQIAQAALHARSLQIAARTKTHHGPGRLRCRAFALPFKRRIFVSRASFTPTAIIVLTTLQPIASAQNPILRHIFADGAQPAQHLPRSVNVVHAPAAVP